MRAAPAVRDHQREVLVERFAVAGHAVAAERLRHDLHRHAPAGAGREHHVLHVVAEVGLAAGHRQPTGEPVAAVCAAAHADLEVEVVHEGVAGDRAGGGSVHASVTRTGFAESSTW